MTTRHIAGIIAVAVIAALLVAALILPQPQSIIAAAAAWLVCMAVLCATRP